MSYQAIVAIINTRPHPNADRLQIGLVCGNQVVVGMDTQNGDIGVFFGPDGELSHDFCVANGLYNASALQALGLPASDKPGFFSQNRRVRAQNFRGVKSDGFWVPLSYFHYTGANLGQMADLQKNVGLQFTEFNGQTFCEKYYTPATKRAMRNGTAGKPKKQNAMFPKHTDTAQFRFMAALPDDAVIYITEKLHGTSGRYGLVLEEQPLTFWQKLFRRPATKKWVYLNGSRNVTLPVGEHYDNAGFYGTNEFRYNVIRDVQLRKGEIIFFEIVGYVSEGKAIMPPHNTTKLKDKQFEHSYGKTMAYTYGCQPGEHKMYVYKILQLNEDGQGVELSWTQLRQRCIELGLQTVPLLWHGTAQDTQVGYASPIEGLTNKVNLLMSCGSRLDERHIREGVVLRIESEQGIQHVKAKSWEFGVMEGYLKDNEDAVDLEEVA
jgi:hypothetical protein